MGIFNFKKEDDKHEDKTPAVKPAAVKAADKKEPAQKKESVKSAETLAIKDQKNQDIFGILLRPVVTERTSGLGALNQYVFEVTPKANKITITAAVLARYGVKPVRVNVSNYPGKAVRYGRHLGRTKSWKKAIITLPEGKSINVYEGPAK